MQTIISGNSAYNHSLERVEEAIDLEFLDADLALFSESNGRFILSVAAEDEEAMIELFAGQAVRIGTVTG